MMVNYIWKIKNELIFLLLSIWIILKVILSKIERIFKKLFILNTNISIKIQKNVICEKDSFQQKKFELFICY